MAETRANSSLGGVDLHLDLTGGRVRAALERALRDAVQTGRLRPGLRLPASRTLATDLGIARNTVAEAYAQLVAEGWLSARQGSGTRVAERPAQADQPTSAGRPGQVTSTGRPGRAGRAAGAADQPGSARAARTFRYDLRPGQPDLASFPRTGWLAAARKALAAAPADAFGYGDPCGRPELRAALAGYLARARGVRAEPDRVIVCTGFTQALALTSRVLADRGATALAVESYGHQLHRDVAATQGLRPVPVPVDDGGADVDAFGTAGAVLLTPAHQFPLGVTLAADRRTAAVGWAVRTGGLLVEDDYDGEFRYDRHAVGALQALAPEHVVYAGTASKALAPGVHLAWLVVPAHLVGPYTAAKRLLDRNFSTTDQLTLAEFLTSGAYDRHVRRSRLAYRRRRDRLVAALARAVPAASITGISAGLQAVVTLPPGHTELSVTAAAAGRGLALDALSSYQADDAPAPAAPPSVVIGYATPPAHAYTTALARLTATLTAPGRLGG
jgi:GntR family transcriptional regulator / MocR family aminotransferase